MKKYIGIAFLVLLVSALVSIKHQEYADDSTSDGGNQSLPVSSRDAPAAKGNTQKSKSNLHPHWEQAFLFFGWPNGITVWALLLTMAVIAEQTVETRRSAKATEDSLAEIKTQATHMGNQTEILRDSVVATKKGARAALLNAQAVINAERALLLFVVEKERRRGLPGQSDFKIFALNYGKVPARRIEIGKPIHAVMRLYDLISKSPDYGEDLDDIQEYLAPGEKWHVATFSPTTTDVVNAVMATGGNMSEIDNMIYGQITYDDGISPERRHSRYCFAYDREPFSNIGGSVTPVGNEEYLECT